MILRFFKLNHVANISYKNSSKESGFTLIELLVAIAIIGILSSIVLTSISSGKNKAKDVVVKQILVEAQKQATLVFYTRRLHPTTYYNICTEGLTETLDTTRGIGSFGQKIADIMGVRYYFGNYSGSFTTGVDVLCREESGGSFDKWVMEAPLKNSTSSSPKLWCVDSNGANRQTTRSFYNYDRNGKECPPN